MLTMLVIKTYKMLIKITSTKFGFRFAIYNIYYRQKIMTEKLGKDLRRSKSVFKLPWGKAVCQKFLCKRISLVFGCSCSRSGAGHLTDLLKVTGWTFLLPSSRCDTSFFVISLKIVSVQILTFTVTVDKNVVVKDTNGLDSSDCVFVIL